MRFIIIANDPLTGPASEKFYRGCKMRRLTVRGIGEFAEQSLDYHIAEERLIGAGDVIGKEIEIDVRRLVRGRAGWHLIIGELRKPNVARAG